MFRVFFTFVKITLSDVLFIFIFDNYILPTQNFCFLLLAS